jgi:hypothetical protein
MRLIVLWTDSDGSLETLTSQLVQSAAFGSKVRAIRRANASLDSKFAADCIYPELIQFVRFRPSSQRYRWTVMTDVVAITHVETSTTSHQLFVRDVRA